MVSRAWPKTCTPANITNGFNSAGIYPFNLNKFNESDFSAATVTERPPPQSEADDVTEADRHISDDPYDINSHVNPTNDAVNIEKYIKNKQIVNVRGDGHCLLYAVLVS